MMDSVKKKINKLFKDGAYQKKGETGREATDADIIDINAVQAKWVCVGAYIDASRIIPCILWSFHNLLRSGTSWCCSSLRAAFHRYI
jgi:hypothetical protein